MTYQELKEEIAKMIFHQTTMEHDWDSRKDWVKDTFRKDTDEILKFINEAGWEIVPKDRNHP
jgi:phosphoribosyl-ATP pyrophosphohydrolase